MVTRIYTLVAALWALVWLMSCDATIHEYPREAGYREMEVEVVLEVHAVLNVDCSIYNEALPRPELTSDMMRVLFYSPQGGRLAAQCFISDKSLTDDGHETLSGRVVLPPGDYTMLAYNFDTEAVRVENVNSLTDIYACTPEIPGTLQARLRGADGVPVFRQPEHLLVCRKQVHVGEDERKVVIKGEARTVVDTYYLQVRVRGLKYASTARATLSGMSRSNRIGLNERDGEDSKIMFDLTGGTDPRIGEENKEVLCTLFNTFGKTQNASELTVRFDIITSDGTRYVKTLDIEPVFHTEDAIERHWLLIDYVLDIPEPHKPGGGFDPGMTEWDEIHEVIEL